MSHRLSIALGCGLVVASFSGSVSAAWETRTVAGADTRIYTPASQAKIGEGRGLLVALHGCSQTADHLADHGNFELAADEFGIVVALPNVPQGGVVAGCWDYYGATHTRVTRHNGAIIGLAEALRDDPEYGIDPDQIYLAGFSSGGGQAVITGCLAPDVFAGVGVVAGPAAGTSISQIASASTTGAQAAGVCQTLAGARASFFDTQLAVSFTDTTDFVVAQDYARINAEMYGVIYAGGLGAMQGTAMDVGSLEGASPTGTGTVYADATAQRVMLLQTSGGGHNWPSGSGQSGGPLTFVTGTGVNFSFVIAEFFTANSLRASGDWNPGDDDDASTTSGGDDPPDTSDTSMTGTQGGSDGTASGDPAAAGAGDATGTGDTPGDTDDVSAAADPSGCQCASSRGGKLLETMHWAWLFLMASPLRRRRCAT